MDAGCTDGRTSVLPFGGHAAAHTSLASRSLPYDGPGALATITVASSPASDDPSADDSSSDSSGCPDTELRHDETIPGPGCFSRDVSLDFYGTHVHNLARCSIVWNANPRFLTKKFPALYDQISCAVRPDFSF